MITILLGSFSVPVFTNIIQVKYYSKRKLQILNADFSPHVLMCPAGLSRFKIMRPCDVRIMRLRCRTRR